MLSLKTAWVIGLEDSRKFNICYRKSQTKIIYLSGFLGFLEQPSTAKCSPQPVDISSTILNKISTICKSLHNHKEESNLMPPFRPTVQVLCEMELLNMASNIRKMVYLLAILLHKGEWAIYGTNPFFLNIWALFIDTQHATVCNACSFEQE